MPGDAADITLFGATGFTGRLVAQRLAEAGLPFRIAGRSAEKLEALSNSLPDRPAWLVADVSRPVSLPALFQNTRLLINCAGPFTDLGERVIGQAAMSGVHYLDTTNELGYVFRARGYSQMAARSGAALVPSCAFEVALADCAAHIAAKSLIGNDESHQLDTVDVVYSVHGIGASQGTRLSAVRAMGTSWIAYRDGAWTGQIPGRAVRRFSWPGQQVYAFSFPSCESITLPAHLPVRRVDTWMATRPAARFFYPLLLPLFARFSRSVFRGFFLKIASAGGRTPESSQDDSLRSGTTFTIFAQSRRENDCSWVTLTGSDPYGLTARIITYYARAMIQPDFTGRGMLAPAQALDPDSVLSMAQDQWGVELRTGQ